jgi:hypothetical protein
MLQEKSRSSVRSFPRTQRTFDITGNVVVSAGRTAADCQPYADRMLGFPHSWAVLWPRFSYSVPTRVLRQFAIPTVGVSLSHDSRCISDFSFERLVLRLGCWLVAVNLEASIQFASPEGEPLAWSRWVNFLLR